MITDPDKRPSARKAQANSVKEQSGVAEQQKEDSPQKPSMGFFKPKAGWEADKNLPVPRPSKESEAEADGVIGSTGKKILKQGKKAFSRAVFHMKSWGTGLLMEVLTHIIPASIHVSLGATFLSSAMGMFLLFPFKVNRVATLMGLISALVCVIAGYWPLTIACGGLVAALIKIANHKNFPLPFFFILPVLLLSVSIGMDTAPFLSAPIWFYGVIAGSALLGALHPQWLVRMADKLLAFIGKEQLDVEAKEVPVVEVIEKPDVVLEAFPKHAVELEKMASKISLLPNDIATIVQEIKAKAYAILTIMHDDSQDVMRGNQFLSRYLPMLNTTIEQFVSIDRHEINSIEFQRTRDKTLSSLLDMKNVFSQAYERLLHNDLDELLVNLKVMDTLRKSDGYDK